MNSDRLYGLTKEEWETFSHSKEWKALREWAMEGKRVVREKVLESGDLTVLNISKGTDIALSRMLILPEDCAQSLADVEADKEIEDA